MGEVGERGVRIVKEPAAQELLEDLERADDIFGARLRAALAAVVREDEEGAWLEQLLSGLEGDSGEAARLRLVDELRRTLA